MKNSLVASRQVEIVPEVPNRLQYVSAGIYFARVKGDGKSFRHEP